MRATRLCSYRTIAIKQKRHASSCKALLQPYAGFPAGYPKSISSRTIFGDRESTITAAAAAAGCDAATTQPPQTAPSTFFPRKVTCCCRVARTVRRGWLSGASLTPLERVLRKPVTGSSYKKRNPGRDNVGSCRDVVRVGRWFGGCDPAPCFSSSSLFACCYIDAERASPPSPMTRACDHLAKAQMPCVVDHECGKIDEGQCWMMGRPRGGVRRRILLLEIEGRLRCTRVTRLVLPER